jgi:hypothetical protein
VLPGLSDAPVCFFNLSIFLLRACLVRLKVEGFVRSRARRRLISRALFVRCASKVRKLPAKSAADRPPNPQGKPISGPLKPTLPLTKHALRDSLENTCRGLSRVSLVAKNDQLGGPSPHFTDSQVARPEPSWIYRTVSRVAVLLADLPFAYFTRLPRGVVFGAIRPPAWRISIRWSIFP